MSIIEAIILGLIQGLTEFIPISSSGHLVIAQWYMNGSSSHLFLEWINIGTVLALIIYFWKRIYTTLRAMFRERDWRLATNILIAAIPAGVVGYFLADFIETHPFFGSIWTVIVMLVLVGILLIIVEQLPKLSGVELLEKLPRSRALTIGLAQVAALIPGTSRSGSTIIAGRLMGLRAADAAEFSFLVSIPIMLGVILKLLLQEDDRAYFMDNLTPLLVGNAVALVSGLLAVGFLMKYLQTRSLAPFGYYRIALAAVLVGIILVQ
jgi:undecaprenyl-diphosphatase